MMYLRPGNLFKDFTVETKSTSSNAHGRIRTGYDQSGEKRLSAVLAEANPEEKERWNRRNHPISHILTQRGRPLAKAEDRLVHGARVFHVRGVDDPGELGLWTIYYVEERMEDNGHPAE